MNPFQLSVPGNLLLAGEYAVTEEGGLGIALGVEPRVTLFAHQAERWLFRGLWPGGGETYAPGDPSDNLLSQVYKQVFPGENPLQAWEVTIDSSAFYQANGRKNGFGSSAATAAILTAALLYLQGTDPEDLAQEALTPAVWAHRKFQGGKGSGYDVAASLFGGLGIFTGGLSPQWTPLKGTNSLPELGLLPGPAAVKTSSSLQSYGEWKKAQPQDSQNFISKNNQLIENLLKTQDFSPPEHQPRISGSHLFAALGDLKDLGQSLGEVLGFPATLPSSFLQTWGLEKTSWKCLGAGNELILIWGPEGTKGQPLTISKEGLKWETAKA